MVWYNGVVLAAVVCTIAVISYKNNLSNLKKQLEKELDARAKAEKNREDERRGRIAAEKALRKLQQPQAKPETKSSESTDSYDFRPVGFIKSCFRDRNGCPRQGILVPNSRALLTLLPNTNPNDSLCNLDEFSYVWLIFIFHENTNTGRKLKMEAIHSNKSNLSEVKSKVKPPRLDGGKVGLFSTRTPHRPNPIGLSIAKIEKISGDTIFLTGIDLVDGTPILDIKPYVPEYDALIEAKTPAWIDSGKQDRIETVNWKEGTLPFLENIVSCRDLQFYIDFEEVSQAIEQVIKLDIRSTNQRNLKKQEKASHSFRFDNLMIYFEVTNEAAEVTKIELFSSK